MTTSKNSKHPSSSRSHTRIETRSRTIKTIERAPNAIKALTEAIKRMETTVTRQNKVMQNILVKLERLNKIGIQLGGMMDGKEIQVFQFKTKTKNSLCL